MILTVPSTEKCAFAENKAYGKKKAINECHKPFWKFEKKSQLFLAKSNKKPKYKAFYQ
jgi:hypothetical protein